jgi:hypothetical protein
MFTKGKVYKMSDELGYSLRWIKRGCEEVTEEEFLKQNKPAEKVIPVKIVPPTPIAPPTENIVAPPAKVEDDDDFLNVAPSRNEIAKPLVATKVNMGKNRK